MKPRLHGARSSHLAVPRGTIFLSQSPGSRIPQATPAHAGLSEDPCRRGSGRPFAQEDARSVANPAAGAADGGAGRTTAAGAVPRTLRGRALRRAWQAAIAPGRQARAASPGPCPPGSPAWSTAPQNRGFLAGTPLRRGKRSGHSSRWRKRAVLETLVDHLGRLQAELAQRFRRPPGVLPSSVRAGGLRHQEPATHLEEGSGTLGQHGRPSEGAGQHPVETSPSGPAPARTPRLAPPGPRHGPRGPGARPPGGGRRPGGRWPPAAPPRRRATRWPRPGPAGRPPNRGRRGGPSPARTGGGRWRRSPGRAGPADPGDRAPGSPGRELPPGAHARGVGE